MPERFQDDWLADQLVLVSQALARAAELVDRALREVKPPPPEDPTGAPPADCPEDGEGDQP